MRINKSQITFGAVEVDEENSTPGLRRQVEQLKGAIQNNDESVPATDYVVFKTGGKTGVTAKLPLAHTQAASTVTGRWVWTDSGLLELARRAAQEVNRLVAYHYTEVVLKNEAIARALRNG